MIKRDLPGYAIGGLSGGEAKNEFWRVVEQCTRPGAGLPEQKPRYLMGVGYPLDIVICVALGVDMFDCVYPCRTARFGTALVRSGQLRLTSAEFANDFRPPITSSRSFCFYLFLIFLCIFAVFHPGSYLIFCIWLFNAWGHWSLVARAPWRSTPEPCFTVSWPKRQ